MVLIVVCLLTQNSNYDLNTFYFIITVEINQTTNRMFSLSFFIDEHAR